MTNRPDIIDELIIKHLQGNLTNEEQAILEQWLDASEKNKLLFEQLSSQRYVSGEVEMLYAYDEEKGWSDIKQKFPFDTEKKADSSVKLRIFEWRRIAVAASILLMICVGSYFLFFGKKDEPTEIVKVPENTNDVKAPSNNRAIITLANGKQVYVDSINNGQLFADGNVKVAKLANGQIVYQNANGEIVKEPEYNTLSNPRGSTVIDMTLADGSRVWLNAGSSVTYPVVFTGNERKVTITGEAYFEVAHNPQQPFKVSKGEMEVTVLLYTTNKSPF